MTRREAKSTARIAEILLSIVRRGIGRQVTPTEQQARREEMNRLLDGMDHEVIDDALEKLFRIAEREARRRAQRLAATLNQSSQTRCSSELRKRLS